MGVRPESLFWRLITMLNALENDLIRRIWKRNTVLIHKTTKKICELLKQALEDDSYSTAKLFFKILLSSDKRENCMRLQFCQHICLEWWNFGEPYTAKNIRIHECEHYIRMYKLVLISLYTWKKSINRH